MQILKNFLITVVFIIACPLSWYAAWDVTGSILVAVITMLIPTWGIMLWVLNYIFGYFTGIIFISSFLAIGGAFITLLLFFILKE